MKVSCVKNTVVLALAGLLLAGCLDDREQATAPVHDVSWFKDHSEERQVTLEECSNNPGQLKGTPNCSNALEAEKQLSSGSLRDVDW